MEIQGFGIPRIAPIPLASRSLPDQDRTRCWDPRLIRHVNFPNFTGRRLNNAREFLRDSSAIARVPRPRRIRRPQTDWPRIASLYATLAQLTRAPTHPREVEESAAELDFRWRRSAAASTSWLCLLSMARSIPTIASCRAVRPAKEIRPPSRTQSEFTRAPSLAAKFPRNESAADRAASCAPFLIGNIVPILWRSDPLCAC